MHEMNDARRMIETCACHRLRVAARGVTRDYDEGLRPVGLRATQVALLAAIAAEGASSMASLARALGMDRSTLTRNVTPLERDGLLELGGEGWRRSRALALTPKGRARLEAALPLWERAQRRLRQKLGARGWKEVQRGLDHVIPNPRRSPP